MDDPILLDEGATVAWEQLIVLSPGEAKFMVAHYKETKLHLMSSDERAAWRVEQDRDLTENPVMRLDVATKVTNLLKVGAASIGQSSDGSTISGLERACPNISIASSRVSMCTTMETYFNEGEDSGFINSSYSDQANWKSVLLVGVSWNAPSAKPMRVHSGAIDYDQRDLSKSGPGAVASTPPVYHFAALHESAAGTQGKSLRAPWTCRESAVLLT
jgi:hypothetical protein